MTKTTNAEKTTKPSSKTTKVNKVSKVTIKQLQQAENTYILTNNDLVHKIISQDFSGRTLISKDKKEREQYMDKFQQEVINLNTLYARYAYENVLSLLKKSKTDVLKVTCFFEEEEAVDLEYDYFVEDGIVDDDMQYVRAESNEVVDKFFADLPEFLECIFVELSRKVLTEDGSVYIMKDQTFEEFLTYFDINIAVGYNIEINLEEYNEEV